MVFTEHQYLGIVCEQIKKAQVRILACSYEWAWYTGQRAGTAQDINRAVAAAPQRGVTVRAILHHEAMKSHLSRINRHTAAKLEKYGVDVRLGNTMKIIHAKFWVFDFTSAIICTHNVSNRAVKSNAEVGVLISSPEDVAALHTYYSKLWDTLSPGGRGTIGG